MKSSQAISGAERILSLDVFRGVTTAFMVLVGNPGSMDIYRQLDHAPWHGWTVTDTVFPTFLWIAGLSLDMAFTGKLTRGVTRRELLLQMLKRCTLLFLIGVAIYAIADSHLATFRILGVLQRIAICSFAASLAYFLPRKWLPAVIAVLLAGYWLVLHYVAAPGFSAGDLTLEGNLAHYIDRIMLGSHNYSGTGSWDPEGVLTTVPAIATTLFGLVAGGMLRQRSSSFGRQVVSLFGLGILLVGAGLFCNHWQPINKKLWTVSYCLLMAGIDFAVFSGMRWLIDGRRVQRGFRVPLAFGRNALAIYILSESLGAILYRMHVRSLTLHEIIFNAVFAGHTTNKFDSLLFALCYLAVITLIAVYAQRRRWVLKL